MLFDFTTIQAAVCGIGCLVAGVFANLPFIIAPPTAVSIFYSVFIRQNNNMSTDTASSCVIISGVILIFFGYRPLGRLATKVSVTPVDCSALAAVRE